MNLNDFARKVSENSDYNIKDSKKAIITVMENLRQTLLEGEDFTYIGFGKFLTQFRPGRMVYSNITHSQMRIPDRITMRFKPSAVFKEDLNEQLRIRGGL